MARCDLWHRDCERYNKTMHAVSSPRRVLLTFLVSVWLGAQPVVLGLTPTWGAFLPHTHIFEGVVTEARWQAHLQEHRLEPVARAPARCDLPPTAQAPGISSVPDTAGMLSLLTLSLASLDEVRI